MRRTYIFFLTILLFSACTSRIPEPVNHAYRQQLKLQAISHWNVLAQDVANRINNQLILSGNMERTVFVEQTCGSDSQPCAPDETSSFDEAFRDLLITNLYNYGVPTNTIPDEDTIEIQYKVQLVRHNQNRIRTLQPGLFTALSTAVVVLRNAPSDLLFLASGVSAELINTSYAQNGHYEVVITTSMVENNEYLFRTSDIYYINDSDFLHYKETRPAGKKIQFSSQQATRQNTPVPLFPAKQSLPPAHSTFPPAEPEPLSPAPLPSNQAENQAEKKDISYENR